MKIPLNIKTFLNNLKESLNNIYGSKIMGVYVHGSLAYGGYEEGSSDIDVLMIVREHNESCEEKLREVFLKLKKDFPIEASLLEFDIFNIDNIKKSELLLKSEFTFMDNNITLNESLADFWIDLAITRETGITILGESAALVIPVINKSIINKARREQFLSLKKDVLKWKKQSAEEQIYLLLQGCRVLYWLKIKEENGNIISKAKALDWAIKSVPENLVPLLEEVKEKSIRKKDLIEKVKSNEFLNFFQYLENEFKNKLEK